jgi:vitamin B12 transporter
MEDMKMTRRFTASLLAGTALAIPPALAQDIAFDLDPIVVEAPSLSPVEAARTGASVEVVDGAAIAAGDGRVVDRLSRLPGVDVVSSGGLGAVGTIRVRGLPARYVGVRIDGIDVSDPSATQNQFDFGGFGATGLDRVELLKGPQSAIYGSEAIAGVVDIVTFEPEALGFSGLARVEAGSFDTQSGALSLGSRSDRGFVALSLGRVVTDGISAQSFNDERDGFRQTTLTAKGEHAVTDALTLGAAVLYRDGDLEIDRSAFALDESGATSTEERGGRVFAEFQTGAVSHRLAYGAFDIDRRDPDGATTRFEGERRTLSYLGSAALGARAVFSIGLDDTEEEIDTDSVIGDEGNTSATAELLYGPTDAIDLSLALRHDDNSSFGGQTTGRLTGVWRPAADLSLRASFGTGYRAPSLFERFSAFGDPDLAPEDSVGAEIGVERAFADRGLVKAALFWTEVDDLIDFDGASTICGSGFGCYAQVPGTTVSKGLELSGQVAVSDRVRLYGAYTYVDAETEGERLPLTPRHDAVIAVEAALTDRAEGTLDLRRVADVVPSAFAPADNEVGDYTLLGATLSYDMTDRAALTLRLENLTDEDYETVGGFNRPGRAVYLGLRAAF